jgi:hyperosmotically inducible protein
MSILRLLLIVAVVMLVGAFALGYIGGAGTSLSSTPSTEPAGAVARAREAGAEIGERAAVATSRVEEGLSEAGLTSKIKAKMALDDRVKALAINVTTRGTTVTLSGTVGSTFERDRALALARETDGVTEVIDDLHLR